MGKVSHSQESDLMKEIAFVVRLLSKEPIRKPFPSKIKIRPI